MSLPLVSASQITLFRECARKWGWRYIAGIKTPTHPAAALGTEVDDTQLQPYLRDDRALDFARESGYIAAAGLAYLPKPKTFGLEVQKHFVMPSPTSAEFGFQGYIDLWMPSGGMPEIEGYPVVGDFKTTGNFRWAKTPETLAKDVQAQLYATWAMWSTGARVVDLVWIYFATKGPRKAKRVHLRAYSDDVADQFSAINATAEEMYALRQSCTDPLELRPSVEMCEAYGGCPYRDKCNLSPSEILESKTAQWARKTETNMADTGGTTGLIARLKAQKAAETSLSPQQLDGQAAADAGVAKIEAVGINPPESLLPPAPAVGAVSNPPASTLEEPVKRKPGRPKKEVTEGEDVRHQRIGALVVELAALLGVAP